jgi:hypothetical protein
MFRVGASAVSSILRISQVLTQVGRRSTSPLSSNLKTHASFSSHIVDLTRKESNSLSEASPRFPVLGDFYPADASIHLILSNQVNQTNAILEARLQHRRATIRLLGVPVEIPASGLSLREVLQNTCGIPVTTYIEAPTTPETTQIEAPGFEG